MLHCLLDVAAFFGGGGGSRTLRNIVTMSKNINHGANEKKMFENPANQNTLLFLAAKLNLPSERKP